MSSERSDRTESVGSRLHARSAAMKDALLTIFYLALSVTFVQGPYVCLPVCRVRI